MMLAGTGRTGRMLRLSLRALLAHRVRAALAVVSVSAGVAAVALTSAVGTGMERSIGAEMARLGVNLLVIRPVRLPASPARPKIVGPATTLRPEDDSAIRALPMIAASAPSIERPVPIRAGRYAVRTRLLGSTPEYFEVRRLLVAWGRPLDAGDDREARRVAVLGSRVAAALFDGDVAAAVGRQVRIGNVPFDVVGVLATKGALADGDEDNQAVIPLRTALRRVFNNDFLDVVFVGVRNPSGTAEAETAITAALRRRHTLAPDAAQDFEVQNASRFYELRRKTTETLGRLTMALGAIALLVGGVGIMGLMLLSVRERTSEIGLRTAVGATPRDILLQFLLEATVLAGAGWIGGLALAAAGGAIIATQTSWPIAVPLTALLTSLVAAVSIGLGFGSIPARQASLIPPLRALLSK